MKYIVVALGVAASIMLGTFSAAAAPSSARQFELVVNGKHDRTTPSVAFPMGWHHAGSFTATSPFCASGTFEDLTNDYLNGLADTRTYACTDGSGTIVTEQETWYEHKPPYTSTWRILGGTGRYGDLRGKGSFVGEPPLTGSNDDEDPSGITYRCTFRGLVDFDTTAPKIAVSSVETTRLRRPAGAYLISLALSLRDNVRGNVVAYEVTVDPDDVALRLALARGSTARGSVALTLRIKPSRDTRTVRLQLRAEDPVGNIRDSTRRLKLPR